MKSKVYLSLPDPRRESILAADHIHHIRRIERPERARRDSLVRSAHRT